jgi:hypothetical protein
LFDPVTTAYLRKRSTKRKKTQVLEKSMMKNHHHK